MDNNPEKELLKRLEEFKRITKRISDKTRDLEKVLYDKETREREVVTENFEKSSPPRCPHHFGYLKPTSKNTSIPDACLACPKVIQCIQTRT